MTYFKFSHTEKQPSPIEVTEEGMVTLLKLRQLEKQYAPNEVTEEGMVMLLKLWQLEKQCAPNEVTEDGILTYFKLSHTEKQDPPIEITEEGMVTLRKLEQDEKQLSPNAVTGYSISSFAFTFSGTTISPEYFSSGLATNIAVFAFSSIRYLNPSISSKCAWANALLVANSITTPKSTLLSVPVNPNSGAVGIVVLFILIIFIPLIPQHKIYL